MPRSVRPVAPTEIRRRLAAGWPRGMAPVFVQQAAAELASMDHVPERTGLTTRPREALSNLGPADLAGLALAPDQ